MVMSGEYYGDGKICLLPTSQKDLDVDFKQHEPGKLLLKELCVMEKSFSLKVTQQSREKDLIIDSSFSK
jgi:hypothetical protein